MQKEEQGPLGGNKQANVLAYWKCFIYVTIQATEHAYSIMVHASSMKHECQQYQDPYTVFVTVPEHSTELASHVLQLMYINLYIQCNTV